MAGLRKVPSRPLGAKLDCRRREWKEPRFFPLPSKVTDSRETDGTFGPIDTENVDFQDGLRANPSPALLHRSVSPSALTVSSTPCMYASSTRLKSDGFS